MSGPDVKQLAQESLPGGSFPNPHQADYRIFISPEVHAGVHAHASEKTDVEICGVIVGVWEKDADGPYARVTNFIRCDSATKKFAEVTFTHESWAHINKEMDSKYSQLRIIGWYHSHPDFGIFLSDRDGFIQENFFSGPGQVALVIDPVRHLEGIFEWRNGKTSLISHYWVGNKVITSNESQRSRIDRSSPASAMTSGLASTAASTTQPEPVGSFATTALAWLGVFLLGYYLHGQRSAWEERALREGTVAHYGVFNLQMLGWEDRMRETQQKLEAVEIEVKSLADDHAKAAGDKADDVRKRWRQIRTELAHSADSLKEARNQYSMGDAERRAIERLTGRKIAEITGVSSPEGNDLNNSAQTKPNRDSKSSSNPVEGKSPEKNSSENKPSKKPADSGK